MLDGRTESSQSSRRRWLVFAGFVMIAGTILAVQTWPTWLFSRGQELTGVDIELVQMISADDGAVREGQGAWVSEFDAASAQQLRADPNSLRCYPMWSGLALDGYRRVRWQSRDEIENGPDAIVAKDAFRHPGVIRDVSQLRNHEEIWRFAEALSREPDTLIAAWYEESDGRVVNYFVYVLDLRRRLLIQLASLS